MAQLNAQYYTIHRLTQSDPSPYITPSEYVRFRFMSNKKKVRKNLYFTLV